MEYDIFQPWKTLDPWQKEYINEKGNCFLLCGRQSGKTTAASIKFGTLAATKNKRIILMIAETEKQAYNLFFKTLMFLEAVYPNKIKRGKEKPTKHQINLVNGSILMCYAAGLDGSGLRTFTLTNLVVDEAAPMAREIFVATMPMLSVTGGVMDIMSTPRGKEGFFYDCSKDDTFRKFYVSAEDCPRHKKDFLENQKKQMSKMEYAQEYLALFLDEVRRVFSDEIIKKCCILKRREFFRPGKYYLGVDVAGMGRDSCTYEEFDKISDEEIEQVENIVENRNYTTDTTDRILELEKIYKHKGIGVDGAGVGFGVFSELLRTNETKRKIEDLNNSSRLTNVDGTKSKKLLKEEMYMNFLSLMEHGFLKLLDDDEVISSLKSMQFEDEINEGRRSTLRIFGQKSHIVEGMIRGAWMATKDKSLKLFIRNF